MTIQKIYFNEDYHEMSKLINNEKLIQCMSLCNDAIESDDGILGDPTETALIEALKSINVNKQEYDKKFPRINELGFDSKRKMMSTQNNINGEKYIYSKGAVEKIIEKCTKIDIKGKEINITDENKRKIFEEAKNMSEKSLRVIAFAYKKETNLKETNLVFLGMVGMIDPPREEAKEAVKKLKEASIKTVMITGDHKDTALAIAKQLDIADSSNQCITGQEIENMPQEELNLKVKDATVFARVTPEHKVKIVKAFKNNNMVVAMTGDGVNDAPSLKTADIGISMGITGTDVAKSAADMVLSDDNFATIEKAVEEGRTIYANIKKAVLFLLSSNFAEIITMFIAILLRLPVPFVAIHILWINLLTDSVPALALGSDPKEDDVMKEKPRNSKESLFSNGGIKLTILYGTVIGIITLIAFLSIPVVEVLTTYSSFSFKNLIQIMNDENILRHAQTYAFTTLAISELLHAVGMRNINKSFIRKEILNNKLMIFSTIIGIGLQMMVVEAPFLRNLFKTSNLNFIEWVYLISLSLMVLIIHEIIVLINRRKK